MATTVKFRSGSTSAHSLFVGASAELTIDTSRKTAVVHDGQTIGGYPLARLDDTTDKITKSSAQTTFITEASAIGLINTAIISGVGFGNGIETSGGVTFVDNTIARVSALSAYLTVISASAFITQTSANLAYAPNISIPETVRVSGTVYTISAAIAPYVSNTTFKITTNFGTSTAAIALVSGLYIDRLSIVVSAQVSSLDRGLIISDNTTINSLSVIANAERPLTGDSNLDGFIQIRGSNVCINDIYARNFARALIAYQVSAVRLGYIQTEKCLNSIFFREVNNSSIETLITTGKSILTSANPGEDGLLVEDCAECSFNVLRIADQGEHGIYIGGGSALNSRNLNFNSVETIRTGQCGFKIKANVIPHQNITINSLSVFDAAWQSTPGPNEDGLRVENVTGLNVGNIFVATLSGTSSCFYGMYLDGVRNVNIAGGHIRNTSSHMVAFFHEYRDSLDVHFNQINGASIGGDVYAIIGSSTSLIRDITVNGGFIADVSGRSVNITGLTGNAAPSPCVFDFWVHNCASAASTTADVDIHYNIRHY